MPILLCDLDDTLVHRSVAFRSWLDNFAKENGEGDEFVQWMLVEDGGGHRPRHELFQAVKNRLFIDDTSEELQQRYQREFIPCLAPDSKVIEALSDAKTADWKIALITNSDEEEFQLSKIEAGGFGHFLDVVVISGNEGISKPDPRIFRIAAERCNSSLEGAWMVGDHPDADIGGAVAAGIASVWVSHGRTWPRTDYFPSFITEWFPDAVHHILSR